MSVASSYVSSLFPSALSLHPSTRLIEKLIEPLEIKRFVIVPNGEFDCVKLIDVFESKVNWPVMVAVEVTIVNVLSVLKIISLKPHSTLAFLFALDAFLGFLISHFPNISVGFSSSWKTCSNVAVALMELLTTTSIGLSVSNDVSSWPVAALIKPLDKPSQL